MKHQRKNHKQRNPIVRASLEYGHKAGKMLDKRKRHLNKPKHKKDYLNDWLGDD